MERFVVKQTSWHYRLLDIYLDQYRISPMNFCEYWRNVVGFMILTSFFVVLAVLIFWALVVCPIVGAYVWITTGFFDLGSFIYFAMVAAALLCTAVLNKAEKLINGRSNKEFKEPGLIAFKYRSWKEKYCPQIEIEDLPDESSRRLL